MLGERDFGGSGGGTWTTKKRLIKGQLKDDTKVFAKL